jgi:DNA invertase Pin-like site-specific DNA recombinase
MERPALRRLMADIQMGKVDIVVVYKIDRLSRSLAGFARMVDVFDRHRVSFSAVTAADQLGHFDGSADAQRVAVLRTVRARSDRIAHFGERDR